jgi:hypothetical protein
MSIIDDHEAIAKRLKELAPAEPVPDKPEPDRFEAPKHQSGKLPVWNGGGWDYIGIESVGCLG